VVRLDALPQAQHQLLRALFQMSEDGGSPGFLVRKPAEIIPHHVVRAEVQVFRRIWTDSERNHSS